MKPSNSCILFKNNVISFAVEKLLVCMWGPPGPPPPPSPHPQVRKCQIYICQIRRTGLPAITELSQHWLVDNYKVTWECNLQMDGATEACVPLWRKKKKMKNICHNQVLIIVNHASVYSSVIILFVGSLWGFTPPWRHWARLHDVQHGLLGLTCKLITSEFCSAFISACRGGV